MEKSRMPPKKEVEQLKPLDAKPGTFKDFEGVAFEVMEVNTHKSPVGPDIYLVAYRIHDNRQAPPYISPTAHLFLNASSNLMDEFRKVKEHYDKIKSSLQITPAK
jgi:hypothetical protein